MLEDAIAAMLSADVEKTAAPMTLINTATNNVEEQLVASLIRTHPFLSEYSVSVDLRTKDMSSGNGIGVFNLTPNVYAIHGEFSGQEASVSPSERPVDTQDTPSVQIPIIVKENQVFPFDVFYDKTRIPQPISRIRIQASLVTPSPEVSAPASLAESQDTTGGVMEVDQSPRPRNVPMWGKTAQAQAELVEALVKRQAYTEEISAILESVKVASPLVQPLPAPKNYYLLKKEEGGFSVEFPDGTTEKISSATVNGLPAMERLAAVDSGVAILRRDGSKGLILKTDKPEKVASDLQHTYGRVLVRDENIDGGPLPALLVKLCFPVAGDRAGILPTGHDGFRTGVVLSSHGDRALSPIDVTPDLLQKLAHFTPELPTLPECFSLEEASGDGVFVATSGGTLALSEPVSVQSVTKVGSAGNYHLKLAYTTQSDLYEVVAEVSKVANHSPFGVLPIDGTVMLSPSLRWLPTTLGCTPLKVAAVEPDEENLYTISNWFGNYHIKGAEVDDTVPAAEAKRILARLGDTEVGAQAKLAMAEKGSTLSFYARPGTDPEAIMVKLSSASEHIPADNIPTAEEVADMLWATIVHSNSGKSGLLKVSSAREDTSLNSVLSLQFVNNNTIDKYLSLVPDLEVTVRKIADLVIAGRLGLDVDQDRAASAMKALDKVLTDLKRIQIMRASGGA